MLPCSPPGELDPDHLDSGAGEAALGDDHGDPGAAACGVSMRFARFEWCFSALRVAHCEWCSKEYSLFRNSLRPAL